MKKAAIGGDGSLLSSSKNHSTGDLCPGVSGWLRFKIIRCAMDHHCPSNYFLHTEPIRQHRQIRLAVGGQQRRQIPGMLRMGHASRIIMGPGIRKAFPAAVSPLMDVKSEKAIPWKPNNLRRYQYAIFSL